MKQFIVFFFACWLLSACQTPNPDLVPYRKGYEWGFADKNKKIVIPPQFENAFPFQEGLAPVQKNGKFGFIDAKGNIVIPCKYLAVSHFQDGLAVAVSAIDTLDDPYGMPEVHKLARLGIINPKNQVVIPFEYLGVNGQSFDAWMMVYSLLSPEFKIRHQNNVICLMNKNWKWGAVDLQGNQSIPFVYNYLKNIAPQRFVVQDYQGNGVFSKTALINEKNQVIIPYHQYQYIGNATEEMILVGKRENSNSGINTYGFVDLNGKELIAPQYDIAQNFSEGRAVVGKRIQDKSQYGFIDKKGKIVISLQYDGAWQFSEGKAAVAKDGQVGFIDKTGKTVIDFKFSLNPNHSDIVFKRGLIYAQKDHNTGFLNEKGETVIGFLYKNQYWLYPNSNPSFMQPYLRVVNQENEEFYIDTFGNEFYEKDQASKTKAQKNRLNQYLQTLPVLTLPLFSEKLYKRDDSFGSNLQRYPLQEDLILEYLNVYPDIPPANIYQIGGIGKVDFKSYTVLLLGVRVKKSGNAGVYDDCLLIFINKDGEILNRHLFFSYVPQSYSSNPEAEEVKGIWRNNEIENISHSFEKIIGDHYILSKYKIRKDGKIDKILEEVDVTLQELNENPDTHSSETDAAPIGWRTYINQGKEIEEMLYYGFVGDGEMVLEYSNNTFKRRPLKNVGWEDGYSLWKFEDFAEIFQIKTSETYFTDTVFPIPAYFERRNPDGSKSIFKLQD